MDVSADSSQRGSETPRHEEASPMFIKVPDRHGVTELFTTDHLFRTNGNDAAFTDLARAIATSLGIPQPGVLYFEYNRRATSGPGLLGLLREANGRGLDHVVIDWERSVRVAGRKRSRSPAVQDEVGGRQRVRRQSSAGANDEQADTSPHLQERASPSRHGSRRSSTSSDLFVRDEATRAPVNRQVQRGSRASGTQISSQIEDLGIPSADDGDDDDDMSRSNNHDSRDETLSIQSTATILRSESPFTRPSKPAATGQSGKKFNMSLFKQKAASKQKKKAGDEVQGSAEARTSTIQATPSETEPAKTTPAITTPKTNTPASAPPTLSLHADSLYHLAPLDRVQMRDYCPGTYTLRPIALRYPDRWYATAGTAGSKRNSIHLMMETSWGEQRHGADRCERCVKRGFECWVLSGEARNMMKQPIATCARCRVNGACSFPSQDR